jgi:hypothetical protein
MDRWWVSPVHVALGTEERGYSNRWYYCVQPMFRTDARCDYSIYVKIRET